MRMLVIATIIALIARKGASADGVVGTITCENESVILNCFDGKVINVIEANYGRTDASTCPVTTSSSTAKTTNTSCISTTTLSKIKRDFKACQGKETCDVEATSALFGDTCSGTYKYLNVSYECVNDWPVLKLTDGTVEVKNMLGEVSVNANLNVYGNMNVSNGDIITGDSSLSEFRARIAKIESASETISKLQAQLDSVPRPPICMPPGADSLQFNGTSWICACAEGWSGTSCTIPPPSVCANVKYVCSHYNGVFRCAFFATLLNTDLSSTNADVSLTGFDIPVGEYVKQIKFAGQLARICALFTSGSVKCVDFSSSFEVTTTYAMVNNGVVEKIQSGSSHSTSDFIVAILESGAIEIMSASSVIPITGLPSTPIVNVAFQLPAMFYVVTNDGRAYTCSLSKTTGACSAVVEIKPENLDTFGKAYPDLLGKAVDVFTDQHGYTAYTFGAALLNDGTIRAWGRPDREGDVNGNVCAIGYSGNSCTTNPMQNVKQASGWADGMFILFEDGTMTRYGRYTGTNEQANTLSKEEDGVTILDGILQIASEVNGKCCAINATGSLFCTSIDGIKDTFYLLKLN